MEFRAVAVSALLLLIGCGPTRSTTRLVEASAELNAANTAQASKTSPYEYAAAREYLSKAREEQSYSDFEVSEKLAAKARDCARLARLKAEAATRDELGAQAYAIPRNLRCRPGPRTPAQRDGLEVPPPRRTETKRQPDKARRPVVPTSPEDEPDPPEGEEDEPVDPRSYR